MTRFQDQEFFGLCFPYGGLDVQDCIQETLSPPTFEHWNSKFPPFNNRGLGRYLCLSKRLQKPKVSNSQYGNSNSSSSRSRAFKLQGHSGPRGEPGKGKRTAHSLKWLLLISNLSSPCKVSGRDFPSSSPDTMINRNKYLYHRDRKTTLTH